jgi:hypoxanthine phosphoribosyltransferase
MHKTIVGYPEVTNLVQEIARQITLSKWTPDLIVGITRGGALPAVMLSQYFDVPMHPLAISLRDHKDTVSDWALSEDAFGYVDYTTTDTTKRKNILIVDDINDSGATFNFIVNDWQSSCLPDSPQWKNIWNNNVKFAVLFDNLASEFSKDIDFKGKEINKAENDHWIDFPWESWWTK